MLLALRSLFELTVTPPVVIPPGFGGGGQTYPFRPVVQPRREAVEVELRGIQCRTGIGRLRPIGSSTVSLLGSSGIFQLGIPIIQASASVMLKGSAISIQNSHQHEPVSVILGEIGFESDDDEATMSLFLGTQ